MEASDSEDENGWVLDLLLAPQPVREWMAGMLREGPAPTPELANMLDLLLAPQRATLQCTLVGALCAPDSAAAAYQPPSVPTDAVMRGVREVVPQLREYLENSWCANHTGGMQMTIMSMRLTTAENDDTSMTVTLLLAVTLPPSMAGPTEYMNGEALTAVQAFAGALCAEALDGRAIQRVTVDGFPLAFNIVPLPLTARSGTMGTLHV